MCIYRRKLKPILQKRAARFYCSLPPRRSVCSTNHVQRRLGFFTSPVENGRATKQAGIALIKWTAFNQLGDRTRLPRRMSLALERKLSAWTITRLPSIQFCRTGKHAAARRPTRGLPVQDIARVQNRGRHAHDATMAEVLQPIDENDLSVRTRDEGLTLAATNRAVLVTKRLRSSS